MRASLTGFLTTEISRIIKMVDEIAFLKSFSLEMDRSPTKWSVGSGRESCEMGPSRQKSGVHDLGR